MHWQIETSSSTAIYEQLAEQIRRAIALGRLKPQERLPSVRQLSRELLVNPNTVAKAYQELDRQGLLVSRPGLGIFVAEPRTDLTKAARKERLLEPLDRWLTLAVHLGFESDEVLRLINDRVGRFQWTSTASS
ncbi:MAG TPA: GntR family transcriptional regulator [Pirellulales bacterium]|jgi:GntR family transcriptional regulator|nr:GntR family transcriptional regulator [Pirellulales bacterium]